MQDYKTRIVEIIQKTPLKNLEHLSAKSVRKQLENELGLTFEGQEKADLTAFIVDEFTAFYNVKKEQVQVKKELQEIPVKREDLDVSVKEESLLESEAVLETGEGSEQVDMDLNIEDEDDDDDDGIIDYTTVPSTSATRASRAAKRRAPARREPKVKKPRATRQCILSDELALVVKSKEIAKNLISRKFWDYVKENDLQDPENKQNIIPDDKIRALYGFNPPPDRLSMFHVSRLINPHITILPKEPAAPKPKNTRSKKSSSAGKNAFNKLHLLSPPLQVIVGQRYESRPQVVKKLWAYIKANQLQHPTDGRRIVNDETMYAIFKKKAINMMEMNKFVSDHLTPCDQEIARQEYQPNAEEEVAPEVFDSGDDEDDGNVKEENVQVKAEVPRPIKVEHSPQVKEEKASPTIKVEIQQPLAASPKALSPVHQQPLAASPKASSPVHQQPLAAASPKSPPHQQ